MKDPYLPRFATQEDALLFMKCLQDGTEFPAEKRIPVFELKDGASVMTQAYKDAPFELGYFTNNTTHGHLA